MGESSRGGARANEIVIQLTQLSTPHDEHELCYAEHTHINTRKPHVRMYIHTCILACALTLFCTNPSTFCLDFHFIHTPVHPLPSLLPSPPSALPLPPFQRRYVHKVNSKIASQRESDEAAQDTPMWQAQTSSPGVKASPALHSHMHAGTHACTYTNTCMDVCLLYCN